MKTKLKFTLLLILLISTFTIACSYKEQIVSEPRNSLPIEKNLYSDQVEELIKEKIIKEKLLREEPKYVEYTGVVEHIFFHPLILDKEAAFKGPAWNNNNMDDWFITVEEFKKVIESLYKNKYILVDPNDLYESYENNNMKLMRRKTIKVPEGKKPLIISIDDLSYNEGMRKSTALKLILDSKGNLATYRKDKEGKEVIAYNEIVILIDEFVKKYPDFSLNGAKGVIALTGYEGIFGYKSDYDSPNYESEREEALKIGNKLKENGWKFASHSYGHNDHEKIALSSLIRDGDKWEKEVASLIGDTSIYIYPHGTTVPEGSEKFKYLQSKGFKIFYGVGSEPYEELSRKTSAVMGDRMAVDGITLRYRRKNFLRFYDAKDIIDLDSRPNRPYSFQ